MFRPTTRLLLALGLAGAFLAPMSADAAPPFAGRIRIADIDKRVVGSDGKPYVLTVELQSWEMPGSNPVPYVRVWISACSRFADCSPSRPYVVPAGTATYAADMSSATINTKFAGLPLSVTWHGSPPGTNIYGSIESNNNGAWISEQGGGAAGASVKILGMNCLGTGDMRSWIVASPDFAPPSGSRPPASPPTAFKKARGGKTARCES